MEVVETLLATVQASRLRGPASRAYERVLDELASRGCAALAYRVTGPEPLEHLCAKHLRDEDRVVVVFEGSTRAWVLLVGAHRGDDRGRDIYDQRYQLAGVPLANDQRRRKPPCCEADGAPPTLDEDVVANLVERARALLRHDGGRSRTRGGRRRTRRTP